MTELVEVPSVPFVLPSLFKIHNITVKNAPFLKHYYWDTMCIAQFNSMMETADNFVSFRMSFPRMVHNYHPMMVVLHVKAPELVAPFEYTLKREKVCDCPKVEVQVSFNTYKYIHDCPHRQMLEMKPATGEIGNSDDDSIELYLKYNLEGSHSVVYIMTIPNLTIRLVFDISVVKYDPMKTIFTADTFPIDISEKYSVAQVVWIFNVYKNAINFKFSCDYPGVEILNREVVVKKDDKLVPLFVKILPTSNSHFIVPVEVEMHHMVQTISLFAQGTKDLIFSEHESMVPHRDSYTAYAPVLFDKNYLSVTLKQNFMINKLITVKNASPTCIKYEFTDIDIPDYITVSVEPPNHVVRPGKTRLIRISIISNGMACVFRRMPLKCNIFTCNMKEKRPKYPEGYFEYTDKGYFEPPTEEPPPKEIFAYTTYLSLNVRVVQMISNEIAPKLDLDGIYMKNVAELCDCYCSKEGAEDSTDIEHVVLDKLLWNMVHCEDFKQSAIRNARKPYRKTDYLKFLQVNLDDLIYECLMDISKRYTFIRPS